MKTLPSLPVAGVAFSLVASLLLGSPSASAQPRPPGNPAVAEALFQQARDLFKQESYAEACPKFAESQRLEPKLGTLLNLAVCHEKLGKIATAWAEYTSAATIAGREGSKDREAFSRERVADLEKKLSRITLQSSSPPAGLRVVLDDQPMDLTALNTPLPIDPGKHWIAASAPGRVDWSTTLDVPSEQASLPVQIPTLVAAPVAALPAPAVPTPAPLVPPATPAVEVAPPARSDNRFVAYVGFGVGAAGVLVGAITGGITLARASTIRAACHDNFCGVGQTEALGGATTMANVSNVSFLLGGLGVGVGVVALILTPSREPARRPVATVTPIVGPGAVGLRGSF
ncbi:MAG: tetratricopeptide repeat protein [Byssovorax sp.]